MTRIRRHKPESVYFYTFHKCASTLFGSYLLKHISGLRHCDYSTMIYNGSLRHPVTFAERGYVYGPLRLSAPEHSAEYQQVIAPSSDPLFVRDRTCLFMVRDPRDILVSSYYSFGFTHPLSPVDEIREQQIEEREAIQAMTVDEYALSEAEIQRRNFALLHDLYTACDRGVLLRYEDMVEDFSRFAEALCRHIDVKSRVLRNLERRSRPKSAVDASQHRRSGKPGQFRDVLSEEAIVSLNAHLSDTLSKFGYEP